MIFFYIYIWKEKQRKQNQGIKSFNIQLMERKRFNLFFYIFNKENDRMRISRNTLTHRTSS